MAFAASEGVNVGSADVWCDGAFPVPVGVFPVLFSGFSEGCADVVTHFDDGGGFVCLAAGSPSPTAFPCVRFDDGALRVEVVGDEVYEDGQPECGEFFCAGHGVVFVGEADLDGWAEALYVTGSEVLPVRHGHIFEWGEDAHSDNVDEVLGCAVVRVGEGCFDGAVGDGVYDSAEEVEDVADAVGVVGVGSATWRLDAEDDEGFVFFDAAFFAGESDGFGKDDERVDVWESAEDFGGDDGGSPVGVGDGVGGVGIDGVDDSGLCPATHLDGVFAGGGLRHFAEGGEEFVFVGGGDGADASVELCVVNVGFEVGSDDCFDVEVWVGEEEAEHSHGVGFEVAGNPVCSFCHEGLGRHGVSLGLLCDRQGGNGWWVHNFGWVSGSSYCYEWRRRHIALHLSAIGGILAL